MISIVMTTYNGSNYILKQLESIYHQTQMPDEVIICDDASKDETVYIVEDFIRKKQLTTWHLYKNQINKGWRQNFYYAASIAKGNIIFFCDQDDIWLPQKIETMVGLMSEYNMGALYTGRRIIDENDELLEARMERKAFSGEIRKEAFSASFYAKTVMGCCMCVSRRVIDIYLNVNFPECGHDIQCGRLALLYDSLWYVDKPLIDYRIHRENNSGVSDKGTFGVSTLSNRIQELERDIEWMGVLVKDDKTDKCKELVLKRCYAAMIYRCRYLKAEKKTCFWALLQYRDCYSNMDMLVGDFAYRHNVNRFLGIIRWKLNKLKNKLIS